MAPAQIFRKSLSRPPRSRRRPHRICQIRAWHREGFTLRQIADHLQMSKSTVWRLRWKWTESMEPVKEKPMEVQHDQKEADVDAEYDDGYDESEYLREVGLDDY